MLRQTLPRPPPLFSVSFNLVSWIFLWFVFFERKCRFTAFITTEVWCRWLCFDWNWASSDFATCTIDSWLVAIPWALKFDFLSPLIIKINGAANNNRIVIFVVEWRPSAHSLLSVFQYVCSMVCTQTVKPTHSYLLGRISLNGVVCKDKLLIDEVAAMAAHVCGGGVSFQSFPPRSSWRSPLPPGMSYMRRIVCLCLCLYIYNEH